MKEDFGIMKYIKKKYYQENFGGGKPSEGEQFPNNQLNNIKEKYFKSLLNDMKSNGNEEIKDLKCASLLVDKIEEVDQNSK